MHTRTYIGLKRRELMFISLMSRTCLWVMSSIWMRHERGTWRTAGSWHAHIQASNSASHMSHAYLWVICHTLVYESCHPYECVTSHNGSWHTQGRFLRMKFVDCMVLGLRRHEFNVTNACMSRVININASRMSHVTHYWFVTHDSITTHTGFRVQCNVTNKCMSRVINIHASQCECVTNESCDTLLVRDT